MNIAGLKFRLVRGIIIYNCSGVLIYKHKASGNCFVRAMKNCRNQRSKNNYPMQLKSYLKDNPSEVVFYLAEIPKSSREALYLASRAVSKELSERGLLYKIEEPTRSIYRNLIGKEVPTYTIWSMTHKATGAVFYFHEEKGVPAQERVQQRIRTFNNYVDKGIVNSNRAMHYFAQAHRPLKMDDWAVRDLELSLIGEREAKVYVTRLCKNHLESSDVVLNRVCDTDVLYYRNHIMKMPHLGMQQYLGIA